MPGDKTQTHQDIIERMIWNTVQMNNIAKNRIPSHGSLRAHTSPDIRGYRYTYSRIECLFHVGFQHLLQAMLLLI